jgi:hypothetical protein
VALVPGLASIAAEISLALELAKGRSKNTHPPPKPNPTRTRPAIRVRNPFRPDRDLTAVGWEIGSVTGGLRGFGDFDDAKRVTDFGPGRINFFTRKLAAETSVARCRDLNSKLQNPGCKKASQLLG